MTEDSGQKLSSKAVAFIAPVLQSSNKVGPECDEQSGIESQALLSSKSSTRWYTRSEPHSPVFPSGEHSRDRHARKLRTSRSLQSITRKVRSRLRPHLGYREKERVWYDQYTAIDWNRDNVVAHRRIEELRKRPGVRGRTACLWDAMQGWLLCSFVGVTTAIFAYWIMISEVFLFSFKSGYCTSHLFTSLRDCPAQDFQYWSQDLSKQFLAYTIIAICFATLASSMTMTTMTRSANGKKMYVAAGSGIPEVKTILSGFVIHGFLGARTLLVKAAGLTLSVATGMNLGKEGPFVHIGCCCANILTRFFPKFSTNESKRREILSTACSAGVAVAFGAPIGGVLFALEEVSYYFPPKVLWRSFFTAAVAAVTLKALNPHGTGKLVLLETTFSTEWQMKDIPIFVFIGIFGGLYGAIFNNLNMLWSRSFRKLRLISEHPVLEVVMICLLTSLICYWNEWTLMGGTELVDALLSECIPETPSSLCASRPSELVPLIYSMSVALIMKAGLTVITFGVRCPIISRMVELIHQIKLPAGIFVPTMCVGALFGRLTGLVLQVAITKHPTWWIFDAACGDGLLCIVPGVYAMIGAAATLAGVTRMTVSLAVIMFELTGSLNYVMPFMVSILTAKWIAEAIQPKGIYDLLIDLNDHPYLDFKELKTYGDAHLSDLLPSDRVLFNTSIDVTQTPIVRASDLFEKVVWSRREGYEDGGFSLIRGGQLIGYVSLTDLSLALDLLPCQGSNYDILIGPEDQSTHNRVIDKLLITDSGLLRIECEGSQVMDMRVIVDRAPITLNKEAPIELAREMFTKLGLRYLAVVDGSEFRGIIHKKRFVGFIRGL